MSDTQAQIIAAINDLRSAQTQHLNRAMAVEALLEALLRRIDPAALADLAEEYDSALDHLAAQIPPALQLPQAWARWQSQLADLRTRAAPPANP